VWLRKFEVVCVFARKKGPPTPNEVVNPKDRTTPSKMHPRPIKGKRKEETWRKEKREKSSDQHQKCKRGEGGTCPRHDREQGKLKAGNQKQKDNETSRRISCPGRTRPITEEHK
jgi:hypothetical protein